MRSFYARSAEETIANYQSLTPTFSDLAISWPCCGACIVLEMANRSGERSKCRWEGSRK